MKILNILKKKHLWYFVPFVTGWVCTGIGAAFINYHSWHNFALFVTLIMVFCLSVMWAVYEIQD